VRATALWERNPQYLVRRLRSVVERYGVTPRKAQRRVRRCVETLGPHGLLPTFATPGTVIEAAPMFFRHLSDAGVEFAFHGHDHADFRRLSPSEADWQFRRALEAYSRAGIPCEGFRCPYLSYTPELEGVLPPGVFTYSSNRAIAWDVVPVDAENPVFAQLAGFYRAAASTEVVATPSRVDGRVEIPASVPDDLELWDGLGSGEEGLLRAWLDTLNEVHRRGELFAPLFHPESFDLMRGPVEELLSAARAQRPRVWLTQLREVARWWHEKEAFRVGVHAEDDGLRLEFRCTDRATVLARAWPSREELRPWDGAWGALARRSVRLDGGARPFVGVAGLDRESVAFLEQQGYVVDATEDAARCTLQLDPQTVSGLGSEVALVEHIERSGGPLVKFSRWPDEAKSVLCFAGDLDALSLRDYARRLRPG
jgi:peptidoglycan/xylan/chitin deacetylase (PgdA/CDA1 family)